MKGRFAVALIMTMASLAIVAPASQAEQAVALTGPGDTLTRFDAATPGVTTSIPVTGLTAGQTLRGIDVRPATGQLYGLAVTTASAANSVMFTYRIDPETGQAFFVGQTAAALAGAGDVPTGYDFNPSAGSTGLPIDRIRYVNTNDENARLRPTDGALAGNDTDLTPAASTAVVASAYDRNTSGTPATTLYVIDRSDGALAIQGGVNGAAPGGPNAGVVTDLGPLGLTLNAAADGGFDISPTGAAFAALSNVATGVTGLYTLNLSTGAASFVGGIGDGTGEVRSLAILDNCPVIDNPDQADLDGDGIGDPCDPDTDGDGLSNAVEAAIGSDPRSTNSDGDANADGADACPTLAGTNPNGCPDVDLPDTTITKAPKKRTSKHTAKIVFKSTKAGSTFACSLDGRAFKPCRSPQKLKNLRAGKHSFKVRAIDPSGYLDPTPAKLRWRIEGGKG